MIIIIKLIFSYLSVLVVFSFSIFQLFMWPFEKCEVTEELGISGECPKATKPHVKTQEAGDTEQGAEEPILQLQLPELGWSLGTSNPHEKYMPFIDPVSGWA